MIEELSNALRMRVCGRYLCVYIYMSYVHNPESTRKILRTRLKREMVVLKNSPWGSQD